MFEQINKFADTATTTITDTINDGSERFTTTSDQVLDAVLDVNRRIVDLAVSTADRVSEQFTFELPFADRVPAPKVAGERYLEFVERAVSLNREMNQRVVDMITADNAKAATDKVTTTAKSMADTASKVADSATKTVSDAAKTVTDTVKRPATKPAVKKTGAKKPAARKTTARKTTAKKAAAKRTTAAR